MVTRAEEHQFEKKAESHFKSYREFPNGRDFRCFKERDRSDMGSDFEKRFDAVFSDAPGSPAWWDKKFGKKKAKEGIKVGYHQGGGLFG